MKSILPVGVEALLSGAVETARIEFKAAWDPETTGHQVIKTLCAFANDFQNINGGYILLGIAEEGGAAIRPVKGLGAGQLEEAQKWIRGHCNRIDPIYMPVMDVVQVDAKPILVLWPPASDATPHEAPDGPKGDKQYRIRSGCETIQAMAEMLTSLLQQTARVPFDDRRSWDASTDDLNLTLVREYLRSVRSGLIDETDSDRIYKAMRIVAPSNGHSVPRNIALLFFTHEPSRWLRGARIEVVEYQDDAGGNLLSEKVFVGPLHEQLRQCIAHIEGLTSRQIEKSPSALSARGWLSFPVPALREAIVNAVYHRSYEDCVEPTKIYLYPNRIEVTSYPGPVPGIELGHLTGNAVPPPVPARNRRIGEFLKDLHLAESRGTGVPKIRQSMAENGSPPARFDFDSGRTYFRATLPAHAEYVALTLLRDYAYQKTTDNSARALQLLRKAWDEGTQSPSVALALIGEHIQAGDFQSAELLLDKLGTGDAFARAVTTLASAHAGSDPTKAASLLDRLPPRLAESDACEAAILERRLGRNDRAHTLFESVGNIVLQDVRALHEFAQTKIALTRSLVRSRRPSDQQVRARLLNESLSFLTRVVQMDAPPTRHAWAWFNIGQVRQWLNMPPQGVIEAFGRAVSMAPGEEKFVAALARAKQGR